MDAKKDIYNLWVKYTTKNDEEYFREFVNGFVSIWKSQLQIDFNHAPNCMDIKPDSGPHLTRLPDELLPAIGKFIIIARDEIETQGDLSSEKLHKICMLIDCLIIICRHFDNIATVLKYDYITNVTAILNRIFQRIPEGIVTASEESVIFEKFSNLIEVIYDPYLTWRNYLRGTFADYTKLPYKPNTIHVEIVPFFYDCFQPEKILQHEMIGTSLMNALGSLIAGSQKSLTSMQNSSLSTSRTGERINNLNCDNVRNGMRAICPATISVIMKIVSKWECCHQLRIAAVKCYILMVIVLQRSSPEERQIELITVIQLYCDAMVDLLKTEHFSKELTTQEAFEISNDSPNDVVDVFALGHTVDSIRELVSEPKSAQNICIALLETNAIDVLISIPKNVKTWSIDHQSIAFYLIGTLSTLTRLSGKVIRILRNAYVVANIFDGLKLCGKPSEKLLRMCLMLAFDDKNEKIIVPEVIAKLIEWLPEMNEREQHFLSNSLIKGCSKSYICKNLACEQKLIKVIFSCLKRSKLLPLTCTQNLIKFIEELAKYSITAIELKSILSLLRDSHEFQQGRQLFQAIATVACALNSNSSCSEFIDIQTDADGIIVPEIKNWLTSGSYGFIFHVFLKLDKLSATSADDKQQKSTRRRMIFTLLTNHNTGFEIFITQTGTLVVGALTRREYLTSSVASKTLLDGRWHFVTVSLTPPKRPFSYSQINVFVDHLQKMSATLKVQAFNEPFVYCSIGSGFQTPTEQQNILDEKPMSTHDTVSPKGMIPSLIEKTFFPQIVSHVPNYFTLPLRNPSTFDPNVKNFPIGMQDNVFGEKSPLKGQIAAVLLAEPITSLKLIFDAGSDFASLFSQDSETLELNTKFVFCYSAAACSDGVCLDLVPGGRFNGSVYAHYCKYVKIQETINSIGGIQAILPILKRYASTQDEFTLTADEAELDAEPLKTPTLEEFSDWEILSSSSYTEWKMIQQPIASFLCLLRYLTHDKNQNQDNLLKTDCLPIIGLMLSKCHHKTFDVSALMATHLFIESMQNQKPSANLELLDSLYNEIVFNFKIWSRMQFQITLGHAQYLLTMVKDDRKYFRKKFGIQFFLDTIRQYYSSPENISLDDARTIRQTLFSVVKFYLLKDVNIKEINCVITFLASVKHEHIIVELVEMLIQYLDSKHCRDQMFLLLHEPQTADLLYNFFIDKSYTKQTQEAIIRLIDCLLKTTRVNQRHKLALRLQETSVECLSLYPGLFSHLTPMELSSTVISYLTDEILSNDIDYCALLFLVHHLSLTNISIKLEVSKKLLTTTFTKQGSPQQIAKHVGWQESISRLLIHKPIANTNNDDGGDVRLNKLRNALLEDNSELLAQSDLISFVENEIELQTQNQPKDSNVILNEIQHSVTEAAKVIETEITELAGSVSGAVAENIANVYSVIRQKTSDIQDTFESLTLGTSVDTDTISSRNRTSSNSSEEASSIQSARPSCRRMDSDSVSVFDFAQDIDVDVEEQLVYLVTNILFTVLWRGVSNDSTESWKERGQVLACINLLGLNNELIASHLTLRLRILEMGVQASLIDLSENGNQTLKNQENASQVLRLVYDLIVLDPNEDDSKKCSIKLLDGVLALLDALMIFQQTASDDWADMIRLCLGLLLKCSHNPNPSIVAMATAKLHAILQNRTIHETSEMAYLLYSINKALAICIEEGTPEQYSFLMPVMKALLDKCRHIFNLASNAPDLPSTSSGPILFNDFQMYSTSKQWLNFVEKKIKPLHDSYQNEIASTLWEPLNTFWAECYEACKAASQKRVTLQMESRRKFQQKIVMPWRMRQVEEMTRLNSASLQLKTRENLTKRKWKSAKRFLYGPRGPWFVGDSKEEFWKLSQHENVARMRLKLEPQLYPNIHANAASLRDNATSSGDAKQQISEDFNTTIKSAVVRDFLSEDENLWIEEEIRNSAEPQHSDIPLEKAVISQECELVTLMSRVKGRIEVNQSVFTFIDLSPAKEDGEKHDFRFQINKIREVHLRKYNLRRSALEIFLIDQTSYFLNFTTKTRNKVFTKILSLQPPNILYGSGRSPSEVLRASGLTTKWVNREISNFEYLMYLNTIAGRSYNDLSQYPVFPWILADYTSEVLDLTDPKSFRNLSMPIGVINPKNEAEVRAKFDGFEDPSGTIPKFHYGTHYSNSAGVLHYLLRVEPFTSLHIELQSGRFDVADRQFHSIPQTWKLLMDNPNDVKELIPEFFYFPEFLKNMNKFDLGQLQITKEKVDDVILPSWANTPEEFIAIHRRALESEYVSQHIHHWIDLIFGYKQKGPKAVEALNVFYYCSYEGAVDLDKISNPSEREAIEGMINNFGQTPSQLLREPHPRRLTQEETIMKLLRMELRRPDITHFLDRTVNVSCELSTTKDPIIFLSVPRSPPRSFLQISPDFLVSISKTGILGCNSWFSFDKEKGFVLEVDATTTNLKNRRRVFGPFHPSVTLNPKLFAVSLDGKNLYAGGIWDNSLRVYNLHKGKMVASVIRHLDVITCIALDNCGSYIVTGSKDCTCIIWSSGGGTNNTSAMEKTTALIGNQPQINTINSSTPVPITTLYGHDDAISCVAIYTELDMVVSGSLDGTVNVYTIKEGQYVRTLKPVGCTEDCVQISFITISYQGHIAFSALDDASHSVHVYSINGTSLGSKYVSGRVTGLTTASDLLVVADDAGDITLSRLYGLKPVFDIPLHVPVQTAVVTPGNTHILAPLRDGRLAVIGVSMPTTMRKHGVLHL